MMVRSSSRPACSRRRQARPTDPIIWLNLAQARRKSGKLSAAVDATRRARQLDPKLLVATRLEAACLSEQHRYDEAAALLGDLPVSKDDDPELHFARGYALLQQHRPQEAIAPLMDALARRPGHIGAHVQLGNAFQLMNLHEEAMQCFGTAALLEGDNPAYASAAMYEALHACKWDELPKMRAELDARLTKRGDIAAVPFMFLALSHSRAQQHAVARAFARSQFGAIKPLPPVKGCARKAGQRIRLAYLSNDLHQHATAYLVAELFERHDRSKFELTLYSYGIDDASEMRRRLQRAADRFIDVARQSDREIAERIRADGIDILVDLKGYTRQARPAVLAYRPAPVQVNFLGYPGTLGPGLADYLIGDPVVTPLDHAADYSEKLALMPHSYQPNDRQRRIGDTPGREQCGLPAQGFVFCCFNNAYKITPEIFAIWCRLLNAVPGSVLWLLECSPQARDNLLRAAQAQGIGAERIVFARPLPLADHLGRLRNADLVLDTLPYNAHTTASDALWAGVPIVTCPGETFASRVAASLCTAAGVTETIADSLDRYEQIALRLASEPGELARLRSRLLDTRLGCALFDSAAFGHNLDRLYEKMHARCVQGLAPAHLVLDVGESRTPIAADNQAVAPARLDDLRAALERARGRLALEPYNGAALSHYDDVRRTLAGSGGATNAQPRALGLLISCRKYFDRALRSAALLDDVVQQVPGFDYRIVVGHDADVPPHPRLLRVEAPDNYESLPAKVRDAFVAVFEQVGDGVAVFKIDDDLTVGDPVAFAGQIGEIIAGGHDYVGVQVGRETHDRRWHWGKCQDKALNARPYAKRFEGTWANGPFYFLSPRALRAFATAVLRFPGEIDGELYEDKFVGDVLRREGIALTPIEPGRLSFGADNMPVSPSAIGRTPSADAWRPQRIDAAATLASRAQALRIAVVTPYYKEQRRVIERCIESVRRQSYPVTHIVVADGHPQDWVDATGVRHLRLDHAHADFGDTPRGIGSLLAVSEGFDAVCFLDADNWLESDHVASCLHTLERHAGELDVIAARRRFVRDDGSVLPLPASEDDALGHIDTSCYFVLRGAFHTLARWITMPRPLALVGDRIYRAGLDENGVRMARTDKVTVNYLCTWASLFRAVGEEPPAYAKPNVDQTSAVQWLESLNQKDRVLLHRLAGAQLCVIQGKAQ
jgi:predicted O-linked N-acetylglucosamine transferase (SPINDLY family)